MSFEPITFSRNIPKTVTTQASVSGTSVSSDGGAKNNTSTASSISNQLDDLITTSQYLQDVILSLNSGLGISVDLNADPDLARYLSQIYNGQVPTSISLQMYSYQLAAEFGSAQVNLAAGPSAPIQANPFQYQSLLAANKAFESQMSQSGIFSAQSVLLLRRLQADAITNAAIQQALSSYPAASDTSTATPSVDSIPASSVDVSTDVAEILQTHIDETGQLYSSMYQVLAQPDPIAGDVSHVVSILASVSVPDLARISGLLQMTQAGRISQSTQTLANGASAFTYPQALTQSSSVMMQLDRIAQMATGPISRLTGPAGQVMTAVAGASSKNSGQLVGVIRSMKQEPSTQTSGPLAGMPKNSVALSGLPISGSMPSTLANLGLSTGLHELSSLLSFSLNSAQQDSEIHQDSFARLAARVRSDSGSLTKLLATSSSISSLGSLVTAFLNEQQNGAAIATQNATSQLATVGRILASSQTGNGTSYTVQGGVVTLTPPAVPAPPAGASKVLAQSGIKLSLDGLTQNLL